MEYGYARISKPKQDIQRQIRNIKKYYPNAIIVKEAYTGTKIDRPEWNKLYETVVKKIRRENVTLIFDSVSRMSRDAKAGYEVYKDLYEKGVELIFLNEPYINTESYKRAMEKICYQDCTKGNTAADKLIDDIMKAVNEFMMAKIEEDIYKAFEQAEKEVQDLHIRTKQGLETARLNGKTLGRRKGTQIITKKELLAKPIIFQMSKSFDGTMDDATLMEWLKAKGIGISHVTFVNYKRELKEENRAYIEDKYNKAKDILLDMEIQAKTILTDEIAYKILLANNINLKKVEVKRILSCIHQK